MVLSDFQIRLSFLQLCPYPLSEGTMNIRPNVDRRLSVFFMSVVVIANGTTKLHGTKVKRLLLYPMIALHVITLCLVNYYYDASRGTFFGFLRSNSPFLHITY